MIVHRSPSRYRVALCAGALVTLLALGACKQEGVVAKGESAESVARKVAASDIKPLPGRWESTIKMERLEMEGMPPQAREAMAKHLAGGRTVSTCLTPEQVSKPDGGFFAGGAEGCTYKNFVMAGGKLDAEMVCAQGPANQKMTMSGTYGASDYSIAMNIVSEPQPGKPMTMVMNVASRRTGDCDGKEDITAEDVKKMEDYARSMERKAK